MATVDLAGLVAGAVVGFVVAGSVKRLSCFRKYSVFGSGSKHLRICSTASSRRARRKRTSARVSMRATFFGSSSTARSARIRPWPSSPS
jgi:hypothetical protein